MKKMTKKNHISSNKTYLEFLPEARYLSWMKTDPHKVDWRDNTFPITDVLGKGSTEY